MFINVIYTDKTVGKVPTEQLEQLIQAGRICAFRRESGWVDVSQDRIRGRGTVAGYRGPERRRAPDAPVPVTGAAGR